MPVVKISSKGQVIIPAEIRRRIGLEPGDKVLVALAPGRKVVIEPVASDAVEAAYGMLREGSSLTKALLRQRREEHTGAGKKRDRRLRTAGLPGKGKRQELLQEP